MNNMSPGSESEEAGKSSSLNNYNVKTTIRLLEELGPRLIESTRNTKQHTVHFFRQEWTDQLIARYLQRPGKPIIHLSDLPDQVIPTLSSDVQGLLRSYWAKLVGEHNSEWGSLHFRCMWDIMKSRKVSRWSSLRLWRSFSEDTGFNIDSLEPYVTAIRTASTGTTRVITSPKLPFDLATPQGAKLFGYRGDITHDTSALTNHESALHSDYRRAVQDTIGNVPFTTSVIHSGVDRTNVGVFVTMLTTIGGLDNSQKQKMARNPLPSWIFLAGLDTKTAYQRSLWDAEGSPTKDAVKLGQSVHFPNLAEVDFQPGKRRVAMLSLPRKVQEDLEMYPPLLLVSASLLLYSMGIKSFLVPLGLERTRQGISAVWMLNIYRGVNMRLFERDIGFLSVEKCERLSKMNNLHVPRSSLPFSSFFIDA